MDPIKKKNFHFTIFTSTRCSSATYQIGTEPRSLKDKNVLPFNNLKTYTPQAWASYQIRKIAGCRSVGNAGTFPRHQLLWKPLVSDPSMHHGTCVTRVPWYLSESLTRGGGGNVPAFPVHAQPANLLIWQEANWNICWNVKWSVPNLR